MITIYDIAKKAGVSSATVSRVINEHPDVSVKTRAKVMALISELGFQPNATARGLATKKSKLIGVFFQDHMNSGLVHPFLQDVLSSFKEIVGAEGYDLLLFANNSDEFATYNFQFRAKHRDVDGVLLFGIAKGEAQLSSLIESRIPCMSIDLDIYGPRIGYLNSDNVAGAQMAVKHLYECGHREIAFFADIYNSKPGQDRLMGFQQAMGQLGCGIRSDLIIHADFSERGGREAMGRLFLGGNLPTAIFCACDTMAIGVKEALEDNGMVLGKDMSMIGYDDISALRYIKPGITTVRQDRAAMGARAAEALIRLIEYDNEVPPIITIAPELVVRQSVAVVPTV